MSGDLSGKMMSRETKKIAGKSIQQIHADTIKLVDERIARSIEHMLNNVDKAVQDAMVRSIGIRKGYEGWEFHEPNGRKSPARICAEAQFKNVVEDNVTKWAEEAYQDALPGMKEAMVRSFNLEFRKAFKACVIDLARKSAQETADVIMAGIKLQADEVIKQVIPQSHLIPVDSNGEADLIDEDTFASAAGLKVLAVLAGQLGSDAPSSSSECTL